MTVNEEIEVNEEDEIDEGDHLEEREPLSCLQSSDHHRETTDRFEEEVFQDFVDRGSFEIVKEEI